MRSWEKLPAEKSCSEGNLSKSHYSAARAVHIQACVVPCSCTPALKSSCGACTCPHRIYSLAFVGSVCIAAFRIPLLRRALDATEGLAQSKLGFASGAAPKAASFERSHASGHRFSAVLAPGP